VNATLEAADGDSWASDINAYIDPTPEAPGTAALLQVGGYGTVGTVTKMIGWANGQGGPGTTVTDTKTDADWSNLGDIDLSTAQLSVGNDYAGATWSGTITVEYDLFVPATILTFGPGAVIDQGAVPKTITWTVPFGTTVETLAPTYLLSSGSCDQPDGGIPTPALSTSSPVTYTVTDGGSDPSGLDGTGTVWHHGL